ncbi:hypothetical protein DITRI_Ditri07aG0152800 [Diplodiscus trichospermus]
MCCTTETITRRIANNIRRLINQFIHVKILGVNNMFLLTHVYNLVSFIGDCPSLQCLEIDSWVESWPSFCEVIWEYTWKPPFEKVQGAKHKLHHDSLKNLITIRVICFSGKEDQMMLLMLLLANAVNLQKLELLWETHASNMSDNVLQVIVKHDSLKRNPNPDLVAQQLHRVSTEEKITCFPRASPYVEI